MTSTENNSATKYELYTFGSVLFLLSLTVVKIRIASIGQLSMILFFIVLFLNQYEKKRVRWDVLIYMVGFGILLTLISLSSPEPTKEGYKFIIKYLFIFPIAYYIGIWAGERFSAKQLSGLLKIIMLIFVINAVVLYYFPVNVLIHNRGMHGFKGTFFESGEFAIILGVFFLSALSLQMDSRIKFDKKSLIIYLTVFIAMVITRNKSIWLAFFIIFLTFLFIKPFLIQKSNLLPSAKKLAVFHTKKIIIALLVLSVVFIIVNNLLPEPIVSKSMIEYKLHNERGEALLIALKLLSNSDWLGSYGFGYIQHYFSTYTGHIVGLGGNVGMIFNSYLNVWISVGILGVIYHLLLLYFGWSLRSLVTITIPVYWFVVANTNPMSQSEYYFIFLGIAAGYITQMRKGET